MKYRRMLCLLLTLALVVCLMPCTLADGQLFFVALNDTIPLTLTSLPYTLGSTVYVPYTVFDIKPGGVVPGYDAQNQSLILFTRERHLVFSVEDGTVTDEKQNVSQVSTVYQGGMLYVPLVYCASHFGLTASILQSANGYCVLRFTTGSEVYDDTLFIEKAENLIAYRIQQYESGESISAEPQPKQPDTAPDGGKDKEPEEEEEQPPATVYLAYVGADSFQADLRVLDGYRQRGTFFFTAEEIEDHPSLVRTLYLKGHLIGLTCDAACEDAQQALDQANDALDSVLNVKSVLALMPQALTQPVTGYRVFTADEALAPEDAVKDASHAHLLLCRAQPAVLFSVLTQNQASVQLLRETSVLEPANQESLP